MPEVITQDPPQPPITERVARARRFYPLAFVLTLVVAVAVIVGGYLWWRYLQTYESTDDAQVDGHLNAISSRIMGTVAHVYVVENQAVKAGQILLDLDPRDYQVALQRSEADLAQAQADIRTDAPSVNIASNETQGTITSGTADVAGAEAGVSEAERQREAQSARVNQARVNKTKTEADLARYTQLVRKDEISRQEYDARVAADRAAAAEVQAQEAALAAAVKAVDQRREVVAQARSRLNQAQKNAPERIAVQRASVDAKRAGAQAANASVAQARLNLEYTKLVAPISGVVGRKSVDVGERVQPGQELLAVVPLDDVWVTANFKESQLKQIRPGLPATIHVDAFDKDYDGYVESLPAASGAKYSVLPPENATGNFVKVVQRLPVRLRFKPGQDQEHRMRPGMSVNPKVWLK